MKQIVITRTGPYSEPPGPELRLEEAESPRPKPGEAIVRMHARPINPADLLLIEGRHLAKPELPCRVGIEGAGVVSEIGAGVDLAVGTKVAVPYGGTWAEAVAISARDLIPLDPGADLEQAAMLPVNPYTAAGLLEGLSAGDWLVQNAANSAVGRLVSRIAKRRGIKTVGVVRRPESLTDAASGGADFVLVDGEDLAARVREATSGAPIARALDAVAGDASGRLFACLGESGELVVYGLMSGDRVSLPAAEVVFRGQSVRGFSRLRSYAALSRERRAEVAAELSGMLMEGALETDVEARYPLERFAEALEHHLSADRRGKILLVGP